MNKTFLGWLLILHHVHCSLSTVHSQLLYRFQVYCLFGMHFFMVLRLMPVCSLVCPPFFYLHSCSTPQHATRHSYVGIFFFSWCSNLRFFKSLLTKNFSSFPQVLTLKSRAVSIQLFWVYPLVKLMIPGNSHQLSWSFSNFLMHSFDYLRKLN